MEPQELSDSQLLAYLDGEAAREVAALIEKNPEYQARTYEFAEVQSDLRAQLRPLRRPSSIELGEYQLGLLSAEKAGEVARYLSQYPYAQRELELLKSYLDEPDFALKAAEGIDTYQESMTDKLRILVAKWLPASGGLGLVPGGVRDGGMMQVASGGMEEGVYEAEEVMVSVNVADDQMQPGYKALSGFVDGETPLSEALLWRSNQLEPTKVLVDEFGDFSFSGLTRGSYELVLLGQGVEVHIQDLTF
ncbi:MAG: hypothetical protein ACPGWR_21460 [Ardenticatenaceae bacterium]